METIIDGAVYKEIKIKKMIVNGKEVSGNIISAEETSGADEIKVGIIAETDD